MLEVLEELVDAVEYVFGMSLTKLALELFKETVSLGSVLLFISGVDG